MKVAITGSHGLIGGELARVLEAGGHEVTRVVRGEAGPGEIRWDPAAGQIDASGLEGHDAVVNLAGASLGDHRWTDAYKATIRDSRIPGTRLLSQTLARLDRPPTVLASGSAVGFYGDRGDEELTESSPGGSGFLAEVSQAWEGATEAAQASGIRVVLLRTGIVQSPKGGALARQLTPFKLGMGGRLGSGRQWLSWVSLDDEVGGIEHALATPSLAGPLNLTAPAPVTNAEFTKVLGRVLGRPTVLPVPTPALWAVFGREMVAEMLLSGQRVLPTVLLGSGYTFRHPELRAALGEMLKPAA